MVMPQKQGLPLYSPTRRPFLDLDLASRAICVGLLVRQASSFPHFRQASNLELLDIYPLQFLSPGLDPLHPAVLCCRSAPVENASAPLSIVICYCRYTNCLAVPVKSRSSLEPQPSYSTRNQHHRLRAKCQLAEHSHPLHSVPVLSLLLCDLIINHERLGSHRLPGTNFCHDQLREVIVVLLTVWLRSTHHSMADIPTQQRRCSIPESTAPVATT
jgi:hypothetical protein